MYLRTTKVKRPDGRVDEYIRLVESYWNDGSPRHRVVCNLVGRIFLHRMRTRCCTCSRESRMYQPRLRKPTRLEHGTGDRCLWRGISGKNWECKRSWILWRVEAGTVESWRIERWRW